MEKAKYPTIEEVKQALYNFLETDMELIALSESHETYPNGDIDNYYYFNDGMEYITVWNTGNENFSVSANGRDIGMFEII